MVWRRRKLPLSFLSRQEKKDENLEDKRKRKRTSRAGSDYLTPCLSSLGGCLLPVKKFPRDWLNDRRCMRVIDHAEVFSSGKEVFSSREQEVSKKRQDGNEESIQAGRKWRGRGKKAKRRRRTRTESEERRGFRSTSFSFLSGSTTVRQLFSFFLSVLSCPETKIRGASCLQSLAADKEKEKRQTSGTHEKGAAA